MRLTSEKISTTNDNPENQEHVIYNHLTLGIVLVAKSQVTLVHTFWKILLLALTNLAVEHNNNKNQSFSDSYRVHYFVPL